VWRSASPSDWRGLRRTLRELDLSTRTTAAGFAAGRYRRVASIPAEAERRLPSTVLVHDALMYISMVLVAGHLFLAFVFPKPRPALQGKVFGSVRAGWAREHHAKWAESEAAGHD